MNIINGHGFLSSVKFCFGGSSTQTPPPVEAPPPAPVPTPSEVSPQSASDARRRRLEQLRYGLASTIKTSARGLTGTGPNLVSEQLQNKKQKLGY